MVKLIDVRKSYRIGATPLPILKGIDLEVESGEFVALMGASGSGKSTLLNILGILDTYDGGEYCLGGTRIQNLSQRQAAHLRNRFIGFVFQSFNLLSFKNALENVALPLYYQQVGRRERNKIAMQYLERVGLADRAEHLPSELSGGQRQRVAIARALAGGPKVILADEPTGALDSRTSCEVMHLFQELNREGKTIIMVTHENDIAQMTQRTILMKDGMVIDPVPTPTPAYEPVALVPAETVSA